MPWLRLTWQAKGVSGMSLSRGRWNSSSNAWATRLHGVQNDRPLATDAALVCLQSLAGS